MVAKEEYEGLDLEQVKEEEKKYGGPVPAEATDTLLMDTQDVAEATQDAIAAYDGVPADVGVGAFCLPCSHAAVGVSVIYMCCFNPA